MKGGRAAPPSLLGSRRKPAIRVTTGSLVKFGPLVDEAQRALAVRPAGDNFDVVSWAADQLRLKIKHVWQPDRGFRKCRILNRAIVAAEVLQKTFHQQATALLSAIFPSPW